MVNLSFERATKFTLCSNEIYESLCHDGRWDLQSLHSNIQCRFQTKTDGSREENPTIQVSGKEGGFWGCRFGESDYFSCYTLNLGITSNKVRKLKYAFSSKIIIELLCWVR